MVVLLYHQTDGEKESDAASLSLDLGFPDEDDDHQQGCEYTFIL
jgi:hypothetical protein